jgi:hypothetical protein
MKLNALHENGNDLRTALQVIYGRRGGLSGFNRPRLHNAKKAASVEHGNRSLGARSYDSGTPWKIRHRKYFRMGNDTGMPAY